MTGVAVCVVFIAGAVDVFEVPKPIDLNRQLLTVLTAAPLSVFSLYIFECIGKVFLWLKVRTDCI